MYKKIIVGFKPCICKEMVFDFISMSSNTMYIYYNIQYLITYRCIIFFFLEFVDCPFVSKQQFKQDLRSLYCPETYCPAVYVGNKHRPIVLSIYLYCSFYE